MNAIEKLKEDIKNDWEKREETVSDEDKLEDMKDKDRKVVRKERRMKNFQQFILYIIAFIIFIWLTFFIVLGASSAPNDDMSPNIRGGDLLFFYRLDKTPSANDVIVFDKGGTRYAGRVVARPGDTVEIPEKGGLKVNNNNITESHIYEGTLRREGVLEYPLTLGPDEYFVLSDAREDGEDSRFFGPVKKAEIKGTVIGIFRRTGF